MALPRDMTVAIAEWRFYAEELIACEIALDELDGDPDLENGADLEADGSDEPACGLVDPWFSPRPLSVRKISRSGVSSSATVAE